MPAETKRKFQTGQPVSTRRRAKKAKLAVAQAQKVATTPSKKDRRKTARQTDYNSDSDDNNDDEDATTDSRQKSQKGQGLKHKDVSAGLSRSGNAAEDESDEDREDDIGDDDDNEEDDEDEEEQEQVGKGKKGYRKKVKKPSGKKGKVFADTNAMLSIIDQVAGKEEQRAQAKQTQMGKIKSKLSAKEQKQASKDLARKKLIEQKIDEIKHRKTEKRKEAKSRAEKEAAATSAAPHRKTVSFL